MDSPSERFMYPVPRIWLNGTDLVVSLVEYREKWGKVCDSKNLSLLILCCNSSVHPHLHASLHTEQVVRLVLVPVPCDQRTRLQDHDIEVAR